MTAEFLKAIEVLRQWGDSTVGLPPRVRLLLRHLDEWVELERRHSSGDPTAVEQAQPILALAEDCEHFFTVWLALSYSAVTSAAQDARREAAWRLRAERERTHRPRRDAYRLVTNRCTACRAPIHARWAGLCWDCAQRWDPYRVQDVEAASAVVDHCWQEQDAAALLRYLVETLQVADEVYSSTLQTAIQSAMERRDERIYHLVNRLARWHAGQADYVTVHDPNALHAGWPPPEPFRWVAPLARIGSLRNQRRSELLSRRAQLRELRKARTAITCAPPHPDIRGIGLEIECGIDDAAIYEGYDNVEVDRDDTVKVYAQEQTGWIHNAEVRIRIDNASDWPQWSQRIMGLWKRIKQNHTCGNHVHVALSERALHAVAHPRFLRWFHQQYWARWGRSDKYTARLKCRYCLWDNPSTRTIQQRMKRYGLRKVGSTRYRAVNWHAVRELGTVEFRLLPHADSGEEYVHAVEWLLRTVGVYLERELSAPQQLSLPFQS